MTVLNIEIILKLCKHFQSKPIDVPPGVLVEMFVTVVIIKVNIFSVTLMSLTVFYRCVLSLRFFLIFLLFFFRYTAKR